VTLADQRLEGGVVDFFAVDFFADFLVVAMFGFLRLEV